MRKTAFIGHRRIHQNNLAEELILTIERQIQSGCTHFIVGSHGEFDRLALSACRTLRKQYPQLVIEVVITSLRAVNTDNFGQRYDDIEPCCMNCRHFAVFFDNIIRYGKIHRV